VLATASAADGSFRFGFVPSGLYVLRAKGGKAGAREYGFADFLLRVGDKATRNNLVLKRVEAGGGSCGGTGMELQNIPE